MLSELSELVVPLTLGEHWSSTDALAKAEVDEDLAKEEEQFERSAANLLGLSK